MVRVTSLCPSVSEEENEVGKGEHVSAVTRPEFGLRAQLFFCFPGRFSLLADAF